MDVLDKSAPLPLYHQLKKILMSGIESGEWQPDEQIPTETDLAKRFGISKITVRHALRDLADSGYVRREQGRGTFVSTPKLAQGPRELTSFTEEMRRHQLKAWSRVLEQAVKPADQTVADALQIAPGDPVFVLKRLRMANDEPMGLQSAHLPMSLAPGLAEERLDSVSLYDVLERRHGLRPARATETHSAVLVDPEDAVLLGVAPGSPALAAQRVTYLAGGQPLEYVESTMRGDRYRIELDLVSQMTTPGQSR